MKTPARQPDHPARATVEDALAKAIGVPQIRVSEIVNAKRAVTPDTALRLARYFGTSAEFRIGMQASYDLETARDQVGAEIEAKVQPRAA